MSKWHVDVWRRDYEGGAIGQVYDMPDLIEASVFPGLSQPPDFTHWAQTVPQAKALCDAWMSPKVGRRGRWFAFSTGREYGINTVTVAAYGSPFAWSWRVLHNGTELGGDHTSYARAIKAAERGAKAAGWTTA